MLPHIPSHRVDGALTRQRHFAASRRHERAGDNWMIHSLSKEVTASCAFYDWNLGFPRCVQWRAASQACSRLAYGISRSVKEQSPRQCPDSQKKKWRVRLMWDGHGYKWLCESSISWMFSYNTFLYLLQISESVRAKWHNSVNLPFVMSQYLSFGFPVSWDHLMAALFLNPPKNHWQLAVPGSDLPVDRKQMANWAVFWRSKKEKGKKGLLLVANKSQGTAQLESGMICLFYFF